MKKQTVPAVLALLSLFLACYHSPVFAGLSVRLSKSKVQLGQIFTLTLKIEGLQVNATPNFMPLQKDFTIEGTESNINYSIINGQVKSLNVWTLKLTAKRSGSLLIPPLQVGSEKTAPLYIEVTEEAPSVPATSQPAPKPNAGQSRLGQQRDLMLLTEISHPSPYVNQQVIYTVKLYNSSRLLDADYQPPQVEDALFVPIGNGRRYQTSENGRIYAVEEQQFLVFPQKTGYLQIKPPTFSALIYDLTPKRISVVGQPIVLNVKSIPAEFKGKNWLPAKQVRLSESYDKGTGSLAEGSTLVRTIVLRAVAVPAQLLPPLDFTNSPQFSVYPEKPTETNQFKQQDLVGQTRLKLTYLLNKAGKVTIPALTLAWFNTTTGKEELSSLPELTIHVAASAGGDKASLKNSPRPQLATILKENKANGLIPAAKPQTKLAWWLAGGFALAWLLTAAAWGWQQRGFNLSGQTRNRILKELQQACLNNSPGEARKALVNWGQWQWPEANLLNLFDLEQRVDDPALKQQINQLAQALYHDVKASSKVWQGGALWQAIVHFKPANTAKSARTDPLPPINRI